METHIWFGTNNGRLASNGWLDEDSYGIILNVLSNSPRTGSAGYTYDVNSDVYVNDNYHYVWRDFYGKK